VGELGAAGFAIAFLKGRSVGYFLDGRLLARARTALAVVVAVIGTVFVGVTAARSDMPNMAGRAMPPPVNTHDSHGTKYRYTFERHGEVMIVLRNGKAWLNVLKTDAGWIVIDPTVSQTHLFTLPLPAATPPGAATKKY
jgi:hypothetical protein